ncbi:hypothetical protein Afil01_53260 [Actinorhabdospora filicis]|uniref:Carboxypeptidase regulatory-like domain-containing protein n=1 Tax=Actinorhabdospora filicis TaxID=1785913 RepID=A0A9W6SPB0_9ACTN|nr:carboxypeptidase-like regulatory domain-containing protein [Actinorhabdospora filicis]GLZ80519.1 hypothetical protein Afil01_53260 [Actinorhabdospora filicis]
MDVAADRKLSRFVRGLAASTLAMLALVVVPATAAHADQEIGVQFSPPQVSVQIGGQNATSALYLVNHDAARTFAMNVQVSMQGLQQVAGMESQAGSGCQGGGGNFQCQVGPGQTAQINLSIAPKTESNLAEGQPVSGMVNVAVQARDQANQGGNSSGQMQVTVTGGKSKNTVTSVTGIITDAKGEPLDAVDVTMKDSAGGTFTAKTNASGKYEFKSTQGKEIQPGELTVTAKKDGYTEKTQTTNAVKGTPANINFSMVKEGASDAPSQAQPAGPSGNNGAAPKAEDEGWGTGTWILAIVGVLFVVGGIVAIVLLLKRGKNDEDDEDMFSDRPPAHTPKAAQTGTPGVYDAGPRSPVMDAPTMIHNGPLLDLDNDDDLARYGSGGSPTGGFGPAYGSRGDNAPTQMFDPRDAAGPGARGDNAATQMFDPRGGESGYGQQGAQQPGYGSDQRGGYGDQRGGYAPDQGGYGQQQGGGYDQRGRDAYPDQRGGYGSEQGGYGQQGSQGYGGQQQGYGSDQRGYQQGGYDQRGGQAGGYGQQQGGGGGYADQRGYDQDPRTGYGQQGGSQQQGYGQQQGGQQGYDQRGGYDQQRGSYGTEQPGQAGQGGYGQQGGQQSYEADPRYDTRPPQPGGYDQRDPRDPGYDERGGYDDRPRW